MAYVAAQSADFPFGAAAEAAILQGADQVIACLDANRIANLRELLETTAVPHLCLFKGDLAAEAGEVAPWLVTLRAGDKLFRLLQAASSPERQNPFALRAAEAGIYFHTDMGLLDLRQHLRRFLRVATQDGGNFLFRFWEPSIAAVYFAGLNDRPQMVVRWFASREGGMISRIVAPLSDPDGDRIVTITPHDLPDGPHSSSGAFKLSQGDVWRFQQVRLDRDIARLARRLTETFPQATAALTDLSISDFTRKGVARMMEFGFSKQAYLFTLLAWDLHFGPRFEHRDPDFILTRILTSPDPQAQRFAELKARMAELG